jgi:hypothetical protein
MTYCTYNRLHVESCHRVGPKFEDHVFQLLSEALNILVPSLIIIQAAILITWGNEVRVVRQNRPIHVFAALVSAELQSTKSCSMVGPIACNEPVALWFRILLQPRMVLV